MNYGSLIQDSELPSGLSLLVPFTTLPYVGKRFWFALTLTAVPELTTPLCLLLCQRMLPRLMLQGAHQSDPITNSHWVTVFKGLVKNVSHISYVIVSILTIYLFQDESGTNYLMER